MGLNQQRINAMNQRNMRRIATLAWTMWGVLHIVGGIFLLAVSLENGAASMLQEMTGGQVTVTVSPDHASVASGVLAYFGWLIALAGLFITTVAFTMVRKNSRTGHWLCFGYAACIEVGYFSLMVVPGYVTLSDALIGLVLFLVAVPLSHVATRSTA